MFDSKVEGYQALVESCNGDSRAAATFLMTQNIEGFVSTQVEAIKNLKIDRVTVWDSGAAVMAKALRPQISFPA